MYVSMLGQAAPPVKKSGLGPGLNRDLSIAAKNACKQAARAGQYPDYIACYDAVRAGAPVPVLDAPQTTEQASADRTKLYVGVGLAVLVVGVGGYLLFGKGRKMTPNRGRRRRRKNGANILGARNFLIGYGITSAGALSASDREMLSRMYGVTESDYPKVFESVSRTKRRESKRAAGRSPWQAVKRAVKRRRRKR